ncbi:MAG TPA: acyltransferase domain-containing protein, partial [Hyphomicrobiales bacterium]|nr:acyltransferase domain-containing protein [Hyphomicrobiales bacterium]
MASARDALPALLTLSAATPAQLLARLERGERDPYPGAGPARLAIIEPDEKKLALARKAIAGQKPWRGRQQIYFSTNGLALGGGKVALLFPGLDSGFEPRADDLARHFGLPLPPGCHALSVEHQLAQVIDGVLAFNDFLAEILARLALRADAVAGHSIGEISALRAAGVLSGPLSSVDPLIKLESPDAFPREIAFLMAGSDAATVAGALSGLDGLYLTHDNCPHQAIVCGHRDALDTLRDRLRAQGILCSFLPFAGGFHSPYFEAAQRAGSGERAWFPLADPRIPLWSAASAAPFPATDRERQALLHAFMVRPVRFRELIAGLYDAGHRIFLQVGTGSLTGFVSDTLAGQPHAAMALNQPSRTGLAQLVNACALLWVEGVAFDTSLLAMPEAAVSVAVAAPTSTASPAASGPAQRPAAVPASAQEDPVRAAILQTLAEIDAARAEVLQLLDRYSSGTGGRPKLILPAHGAEADGRDGHRYGLAPSTQGNDGAPLQIDRHIVRLLDLATTIPWVADHALHPQRPGWPVPADGHPVVPMTMEIQMVRRAAEAALPGFKVIEMRQVQAYRWLGVAEPVEV